MPLKNLPDLIVNRRVLPRSLVRRKVVLSGLLCGMPITPATAFLWNSAPKNWDELDRLIARKFPNIPSVSTQQLAHALTRPAQPLKGSPLNTYPWLLDVRPLEEYAISHLPNALNTPDEAKIIEVINKAAHSQALAQPCVLYCSVGYRSAQWVERLNKRGYKNVFNLSRSLFMWANEGRPLENKQGAATQVHPFGKDWEHLLDPPLRASIKPNG